MRISMVTVCAALSLAACGPVMVIRQGGKMFSEMSDRSRVLEQQRQALWTRLSPELKARCGPMPAVLAPLPAAQASVLFDTSDEALTVPREAVAGLPIGSARWAAASEGGADYIVRWQRSTVHQEPALDLQELLLQVTDASGHVLRQDRQFSFDWQAAMNTGYLRCPSVRVAGAELPALLSVPDFTGLQDFFGRR